MRSPAGPSSLGEVGIQKLGKVTKDPLWDIPDGPLHLGEVEKEKLDPLMQKPAESSSHGEA